MVAGTIAGIARHAFPKAPMETIDAAVVTRAGGIAGDFRGAMVVEEGAIAIGDTIRIEE